MLQTVTGAYTDGTICAVPWQHFHIRNLWRVKLIHKTHIREMSTIAETPIKAAQKAISMWGRLEEEDRAIKAIERENKGKKRAKKKAAIKPPPSNQG